MNFPQSFKYLCLFLALGISIVAAQPVLELPEPVNSNFYCNQLYYDCPECDEGCEEIYEPVCAKYYGPCYDVTCSVLYKTYSNACELCRDEDTISFTYGPCEGDCGEECEEEEEEWEGCYEECENCEEEDEEEEEECDQCEEEEEVYPDYVNRV